MRTSYLIAGVIIILVLAVLAYLFTRQNPTLTSQLSGTPTTTVSSESGNNLQSSSVSANAAGAKSYTNFLYGYTLDIPADALNSVGSPEQIFVGYKSGTTSPDAQLKISVGLDVTHIAYCLTIPQGAKGVATTTLGGSPFLTYTLGSNTATSTSTTYYKTLHDAPRGNICYDIQKNAQGSSTLNTKLDNILKTFSFKAF